MSPHDNQRWIEQYLNALVAERVEISRARPRDGLLALLAEYGNPQHQLRCIRVAGSKGKGSTSLILEALLQQAGYRVGVFTSPHINHWGERIRLNGRPAPGPELAMVLAELAPQVTALRADDSLQGPGFFEVLLAAALVLFARETPDIVIVECGIGAATDATAVVPAELGILTTVEAEHLALIGPTLEDVAREKAGVMAADRPAIIGRLPAQAMAPVQRQAFEQCASLHCLGQDFEVARHYEAMQEPQLSWQQAGQQLTFPVTPALYWLADNVALAVAAAGVVLGETPDATAVTAALGKLQLPGRLETLAENPTLVADSAHTRASARLLACYLAARPESPKILVAAFSNGHDARDLPEALWQQADGVVVTRADERRGQLAENAARTVPLPEGSRRAVLDDPDQALHCARQLAGAEGLVCTVGSVYMAACMRRWYCQLSITS